MLPALTQMFSLPMKMIIPPIHTAFCAKDIKESKINQEESSISLMLVSNLF